MLPSNRTVRRAATKAAILAGGTSAANRSGAFEAPKGAIIEAARWMKGRARPEKPERISLIGGLRDVFNGTDDKVIERAAARVSEGGGSVGGTVSSAAKQVSDLVRNIFGEW